MRKLFEDAAKLFSNIGKKGLADERQRIIEQQTLESAPTVILKTGKKDKRTSKARETTQLLLLTSIYLNYSKASHKEAYP
nr:hypothetical protein [Tanacetum cinerariifolium]